MPVEMPNIWKEPYSVRYHELDQKGKISILSLCNLMQETASKHALALGLAIQQLLDKNYTWVLSRLTLRISAYPGWKDEILVSTWPSGIKRLFALRDFRLMDENNRVFGAAVSAWLVIDAETRRPVRIERFLEQLKPFASERALPDDLDKLGELTQTTGERRFRIRFRDLDMNQHVNNVSYIEWVLESLPFELRNSKVLSKLKINFLAEAGTRDRVISVYQSVDDTESKFLHHIIREENGQELVRAETTWTNRS
jgi:acyl-ACP thioesterase